MRSFAENTSVKGIGRTVRAKSRIVRTCWIVFLFVCLGLLLLQVITVLVSYYNYVVTRNKEVVQTTPDFPEVTFCNIFPASYWRDFDGRYSNYQRKLHLLRSSAPDEMREGNRSAFWAYFRSLVAFSVNVIEPRLKPGADVDEDGFLVECRQNMWDLYEVKGSCRLEPTLERPLQRCVHLRPSHRRTAIVKLILFIDDFWTEGVDAFYSWTRMPMSSGVRVMIHPSGVKPDARTAILISPGSDAIISVRQTNITRMNHPTGNCTERRFLNSAEQSNSDYSQATCTSLCRQQQTIDTCGCIDTFEYFTDLQLRSVNGTFCMNISDHLDRMTSVTTGGTNRTKHDSVWAILKCYWYYEPMEEKCNCPLPCTEVSYEYTLSSARWPSAIYQMSFYDRYIYTNPIYADKFSVYKSLKRQRSSANATEMLDMVRSLRLIEDNFLQVTIRMVDKTVTKVNDLLSISWDTMASNLGGCLNLWLGISVLTAAEVIELFYSLVRIVSRRKTTDTNGNDATNNKTDNDKNIGQTKTNNSSTFKLKNTKTGAIT